jgi:hypothetical protein
MVSMSQTKKHPFEGDMNTESLGKQGFLDWNKHHYKKIYSNVFFFLEMALY